MSDGEEVGASGFDNVAEVVEETDENERDVSDKKENCDGRAGEVKVLVVEGGMLVTVDNEVKLVESLLTLDDPLRLPDVEVDVDEEELFDPLVVTDVLVDVATDVDEPENGVELSDDENTL